MKVEEIKVGQKVRANLPDHQGKIFTVEGWSRGTWHQYVICRNGERTYSFRPEELSPA